MMNAVARNIRIFRSQVRGLSISEAIHFILRSLFKRENILIYVKELVSAIQVQSLSNQDGSIIKGEREDIERLRRSMQRPFWEFSCDLYDGVRDYFIYKKNDTIGHISWIYYKNDPNRIIKLGDNQVEIKHCLTLPQFRGQGIYPATLIQIQKYLKDKRYQNVFISVKDDNAASIRGIEKAGFKFTAKINLVKLFGIQLSRRYVADHREKYH
jgi:RimJ/RimL family protein N-acetyltransferase